MNKFTYNFYEKDGDLEDQISDFLKSHPESYIVEDPTLSNASLGQYEASFIEGISLPVAVHIFSKIYTTLLLRI